MFPETDPSQTSMSKLRPPPRSLFLLNSFITPNRGQQVAKTYSYFGQRALVRASN